MEGNKKLQGSFRDPSGFVYYEDGKIYRQINKIYKKDYYELIESGLYKSLTDDNLLVSHQEVDNKSDISENAYKIIQPEEIPFISYPYEWCFSQLKDAALLTLIIQKTAISFGMSLKDATAYNIQFKRGKPIFIDTLSFEHYNEGTPWVAYRQFCQHFLAPLALMSHTDIRLNQLLRIYIDGIPLDLASQLLPGRTRMRFSLLTHIHLHAKSQKHYGDKTINIKKRKVSRVSFLGIIDSLEKAIKKLTWKVSDTEWADYYSSTNYSSDSFEHKKKLISEFLNIINPEKIWDIGANEGMFSRIDIAKKIPTIAFDIDPAAIENNYLKCASDGDADMLPLLLDVTNPSPSIGWDNCERMSFLERGPTDTIFALALIHHLAISNNLPISKIAGFFYSICESLIIEFVPKTDSQVQKLLATREDIFPDYNQKMFEREFGKYFTINKSSNIKSSDRILYLMKKKS